MWLPEGKVHSVLQITHGMTEHIGRFEILAQELTEQGIAVAGFDLRGHGKNPGDKTIAAMGNDGWEASIEDMHLLFLRLRQIFPKTAHYMLGFSLGSFLLREYLGRYPEDVAGAIIMGTGYQPGIVLSVMMSVVKTQIRKAGFDNTTDLIKQLSFGAYNQEFKPNRTEADWLCGDKEQLDLYLSDPLCKKTISAGLFWQMLDAMKRTGKKDAYRHWNKDTPILLMSGRDDPVGNFGNGVRTLRKHMKKAGINRLTMQLMPDARHDVLHEEACGAGGAARAAIASWIVRMKA